MRSTGMFILLVVLCSLLGMAPIARAADEPEEQADTIGRTPPRLSLVEGQVSFWRPGAQDWVEAQINTALAPGDQLYAGEDGNLELQIGGQAFARGGADTQIGLESQEPDFLQFKVTAGSASFDLRSLAAGRTVEVDTPHAAFTINHAGYYRLDVREEQTVFITRRGGRATAMPANAEAVPIGGNQAVTIEGAENFKISSRTAPPLDSWDNWNYARTDQVLEEAARSARYVSPGTYGVGDLGRYGTWRWVPEYGYVWVPSGVAVGWVPYSTGTWMLDPYYGWTWVDTAPWGWAPYHYGRWVYVSSFWCWAPGPIIVRPVYAPALVAFYGQPGVSISIGFGGPLVGWVALGWGEPLIPWWGRRGFIHRPWWGGWRGPRCINGRPLRRGTVVRVTDIRVYRNTRVSHALVVVDRRHFGHGRIHREHFVKADVKHLRLNRGAPKVKASPANFVPTTRSGLRPPRKSFQRAVVTHWQSRESRDTRRLSTPSRKYPSTMERRSSPTGSVRRKEGHFTGRGARTLAPKTGYRQNDTAPSKRRSRPQVVSPRPAAPPAVPRHGKVNRPERVEARTSNPGRRPARTQSPEPQGARPRMSHAPAVRPSAPVQRPGPTPAYPSPIHQGRTRHRADFPSAKSQERVSPTIPANPVQPSRQSPRSRQFEYQERTSRGRIETNAPGRSGWQSPAPRGRFSGGGRGGGRYQRWSR